MTERLQARIDLRTHSLISGETNVAASAAAAAKKYEQKLDQYIKDFINLRAENDIVIEKYQKTLDDQVEKRMVELNKKLDYNINET